MNQRGSNSQTVSLRSEFTPYFDTTNKTVQGYPSDWYKKGDFYLANHTKQLDQSLSQKNGQPTYIPQYAIKKDKHPRNKNQVVWRIYGWNAQNGEYQPLFKTGFCFSLKQAKSYVDIDVYEFNHAK